MLSLYETLVCDLKLILKNNNIKYKDILKLINNQKYDEIIELINDESIHNLIENIINERERIGNSMENKLNNLLWLNDRLIQFGEEPQPSKTKALNVLKNNVFINIYDLEAEKYEKRTTKKQLQKDLKKNIDRCYSLCIAKNNPTLKCFLITSY